VRAATSRFRARVFESLRAAEYRRVYISLLVAMSGFWMRIATLSWFVYELTGSRALLGVITSASLLPWVVFAPVGGVLADRVDPRRLVGRLLLGVCVLNVAFGIWVLVGDVTLWQLMLVATLSGCLRGMEHPARQALMLRLVSREGVQNAIGLNAAAFHFTSAIGPVVAGVVYGWGGAGPCFILVGLAMLPMVWLAPRVQQRFEVTSNEPEHPLRALVDGFRYVAGHVRTRLVLLTAAAAVLFLWSFRTLLAPLSKDVFGLGEVGYGFVMGFVGLGSFLGALFVAAGARVEDADAPRVLRYVVGGAACVAGLAFTQSLAQAALLLLGVGFASVAFMARSNVLVQGTVPEELRARVMGIWALTFGLCWPLGSLMMGMLAEHLDLRVALLTGCSAALLLSTASTIATTRRKLVVAAQDELRQVPETRY
jgi:MFS family permease